MKTLFHQMQPSNIFYCCGQCCWSSCLFPRRWLQTRFPINLFPPIFRFSLCISVLQKRHVKAFQVNFKQKRAKAQTSLLKSIHLYLRKQNFGLRRVLGMTLCREEEVKGCDYSTWTALAATARELALFARKTPSTLSSPFPLTSFQMGLPGWMW